MLVAKVDFFWQNVSRIFKVWPYRLVVRTPGFHPGNRGSIPLRVTNKIRFRGTERRTEDFSAEKSKETMVGERVFRDGGKPTR